METSDKTNEEANRLAQECREIWSEAIAADTLNFIIFTKKQSNSGGKMIKSRKYVTVAHEDGLWTVRTRYKSTRHTLRFAVYDTLREAMSYAREVFNRGDAEYIIRTHRKNGR